MIGCFMEKNSNMENKFKSYKELSETSIEEWAKELDACEKRILEPKEYHVFMVMYQNEKAVEDDKDKRFKSLLNGWNGTNLINRRLLLHSYTMTKATQIFCGMLINSPGEMVMMANYFQYKCHLHHIKHIDMRALSEKIIPMGWFSRDTLQQFWDKQKYVAEDNRLLNMLDNPEYGRSIREL